MSKNPIYVILTLSVAVTLWLLVTLSPTSIGGWLLFGGWLLSPYFFVYRSINSKNNSAAFSRLFIMTTLVSLIGITWLVYIIFISPDPQGAIAILFVPPFQILAYAISRNLKVKRHSS